MNQEDFENKTIDLERRLDRANKLYHKCLGTVLEKFLQHEKEYENVQEHCLDQKRRVDVLLKELKEFH
eukprot:403351200